MRSSETRLTKVEGLCPENTAIATLRRLITPNQLNERYVFAK